MFNFWITTIVSWAWLCAQKFQAGQIRRGSKLSWSRWVTFLEKIDRRFCQALFVLQSCGIHEQTGNSSFSFDWSPSMREVSIYLEWQKPKNNIIYLNDPIIPLRIVFLIYILSRMKIRNHLFLLFFDLHLPRPFLANSLIKLVEHNPIRNSLQKIWIWQLLLISLKN